MGLSVSRVPLLGPTALDPSSSLDEPRLYRAAPLTGQRSSERRGGSGEVIYEFSAKGKNWAGL